MEIEGCDFPEGLLYDPEESTWVRMEDGSAVIGVTTVLSGLAGRFTSVRLKPVGEVYAKGRSLATIESVRFVGPMRTPLTGRLVKVNESLLSRPKIVNDHPYGEGWIARLEPMNADQELPLLSTVELARERIAEKINQLRVKCWKAYPDHELFEIGVECAAALVRLEELMEKISVGEVVHVVSDDPTADIEMVRWSERTNHPVLESRREGNLHHFIVRRVGRGSGEP